MSTELLQWYVDERLDQSDVMVLQVPAGSAKDYLLQLDYELDWEGRRYVVAEREDERIGSTTTVKVTAQALWYELNRDTYLGTLTLQDATPAAGLATILDGTGWTVSTASDAVSATYSMEADDQTHLALARSWAKITGLYLRFDTAARQVILSAQRGADRGVGYRYRRNVERVKRRVTPPRITRLYAYGADDLTFSGINGGREYVEDLSYYTDQGVNLDAIGPDGRTNRERLTRSVVLKDQSFVDDAALLAWANRQLQDLSGGTASYEIEVIDLSTKTGQLERPRAGDTVRVSDPAFAWDLQATVVRVLAHPNEPVKDRVELAVNPPAPPDPATSVGRGQQGDQWFQFLGPIQANFQVRNDGTWTVARIPLRFRDGGRFHLSLDLSVVGVGAGDVTAQLYDAEAAEVVWAETLPYTDAATTRFQVSFAREEIPASTKDLRLRITVAGSGGADPSNGVNLTKEDADEGLETANVGWWVMAQRAVRQTPTVDNTSQTFPGVDRSPVFADYTEFTVPDNVTEVGIVATGGTGGGARAGAGGRVEARFAVTPGETLYVWPAGQGGTSATTFDGGFPNGGAGSGFTGDRSNSGGGASIVARTPNPDNIANQAQVLIVAPGGGGSGGGADGFGGDGGFFAGEDGTGDDGGVSQAQGATQYNGGAGAGGGAIAPGNPGSYMLGGQCAVSACSLCDLGGGGGGGYYGGGGGGGSASFGALDGGGGGGGSGWVHPDAFDLIVADGANAAGVGSVVISWNAPE